MYTASSCETYGRQFNIFTIAGFVNSRANNSGGGGGGGAGNPRLSIDIKKKHQ